MSLTNLRRQLHLTCIGGWPLDIVPPTSVMRIGWMQFFAVTGLLVAFAALLPTHYHSHISADLGEADHSHHDHPTAPVSNDEAPLNDSHPTHDCPVCRITASLTLLTAPTALLSIQPTPRFALPIDQTRPISTPIVLPFHGRAPPAC